VRNGDSREWHHEPLPRCLRSLRVDNEPSDRSAGCGGMMKPILIEPGKKGNRIVHEWQKCGHRNRLSPDDENKTVLRIMSERAWKPTEG
jgi:RNHCP domain